MQVITYALEKLESRAKIERNITEKSVPNIRRLKPSS